MNTLHFISSFSATTIDDFWASDTFPLDSEELCDTAINSMLLIMNNRQRAAAGYDNKHLKIYDYAALVKYGVRFPWKERISFKYFIDLQNDTLPDCAVIGRTGNNKGVFSSAIYAFRLDNRQDFKPNIIPRCLRGANIYYRTGRINGYEGLSKAMATENSNDIESVVHPGYAAIFNDGVCIGADPTGKPNMDYSTLASYVIGMHNDRKHFWNVSAEEEYFNDYPARVHFSIDKEFIKSLFYARNLPYTETGRLRPILHWVKCHKRRLKEGVDIDIKKYLRGINQFEMHGLNFDITSPIKTTKK